MESVSDQVTKTDVGYQIPTWNNWSPLARFYHPLQAGSIDGTDTVPHDRAVSRATVAKYKPNKRVSGDPDSTLFVGKLSKETSEATVFKIFSKCGELTRCRIVRDVVTGFSRGYAFVEYRSERDANAAWRELHGKEIDGCPVLVEYEAARSLKGWIPRRLGGGFGGKKESGQLRFGGRDRPFRRPIPSQQDGNPNKFLRGSQDHEAARAPRDNSRDTYRERKSDSARESYTYRERERERDRDRSRDKRERDRESSRSSSYYREREGDSEGKRYRERDSERSRDRGGERYKDRERYGDSEGSRYKERHGHRDKRRNTYEAGDKRKDSSSRKSEQEEGEVQ
ncbi:hypothetical protein ACROYT_G003296 [Oculina patagonica]